MQLPWALVDEDGIRGCYVSDTLIFEYRRKVILIYMHSVCAIADAPIPKRYAQVVINIRPSNTYLGNSSSNCKLALTFMLINSWISSFAAYGMVILITPTLVWQLWHQLL